MPRREPPNQQLLAELADLRRRIRELEGLESGYDDLLRDLNARIERIQKQDRALVELAQSRHQDLEPALREITRVSAHTLRCERVGIWVYNDERSAIHCVDLYELSKDRHSSGMVLKADDYPGYFDALGDQRAVAADDARNDPRTREFRENYLVPRGITSMLDAAIRIGGKVAGIVCHEHVGPPRTWQRYEISFAASVADLAALRMESRERREAQTALQEAEERLRMSQRLEAVGRLAGGISHDFNNLLTVIIGSADLMLRDLAPDHPHREPLEAIAAAGESAASLTRQLLAFSRRQVLKPKILDLNHVVADMEKMLRRLIGENVELVVRCASDLGRVMADPGQLEQVIVNLAINARDAMPGGGTLTIETANVEMGDRYAHRYVSVRSGPHVLLVITDTGVGMNEETRSRIFEPFYTTKEQGKGTGLGLATVYGIVKQSGGSIWVYSEPGKGTSFKVYLPRVDDEPLEEIPSRERTEASLTGSETVLVVEDEDTLRKMIGTALRRYGFTVLQAAEGEEALRLCREHPGPIHLLLTDVVMPGMEGPGLAKCLSEARPAVRTLYMAGYTGNTITHQGVSGEEDTFLQKPFTLTELVRKVRDVLDSRPPEKAE